MSKGLDYKKGMGESVLKAQASRIRELKADLQKATKIYGEWADLYTTLITELRDIPKRVGPFTAKTGEEWISPQTLTKLLEKQDEP